MPRRLILLAAPALVLLWTGAARPQAPAADPRFDEFRGRFHGVWRNTVDARRAQRIVDTAIEQCVGAMSFFVRGIARSQLRDNTPANTRIDLWFRDDGRITVRFDERHAYTTRVGRTSRLRTPEGDEMRVTQRFRDDGNLEQVFATDRGTRWNVYSIEAAGEMQVEATTQGMMMPQPLHFVMGYRRDP